MKKILYTILIIIFLLSSCLKPQESKYQIKVNISFSSETKGELNKDINEANGTVILRIDSPLGNFGQAYLKMVDTEDKNNIKTIELNRINETLFSGSFQLNESGRFEIIGVFILGGIEYESENKLYINVYDYKKELEPSLKFKNLIDNKIVENNMYEPYRNHSILVNIDSSIIYNSDFSYKIYINNNLLEEGNIQNKSFESTPVFLENKKYIISVEVFDNANNGFGRTTVELNPKNIDTSFNLSSELRLNSYEGTILTNNSSLTTIDPIYINMEVIEKYSLPASYMYTISNGDEIIKEITTDKKEFKYNSIFLKEGINKLSLIAKNLITNYSTNTNIILNVEKFTEFTVDLDIYKKDYLDNNIKINNTSEITNRDPLFFKIIVDKKYDFSTNLNYEILIKKDGIDYKKINISSNSMILETDTMYLEEGNYELIATVLKNDTNFSEKIYRTFKIYKAINNFNLDFSLIQKNSDQSTKLYYLPEKINVDPESTSLNDFDIVFDIKSNYSYPATYVYSININGNNLFSSNPVQSRLFKYTSYEFPIGHNYIEIYAKDLDTNYEIKKSFEVLVKENNPPILYKVSIEGTNVYYEEENNEYYDLPITSPIENPRIVIEFRDESEFIKKDYININIKIIENNTNIITPILLHPSQKNKYIKYWGTLEGITLDSSQTWEIKIDPSQILDEFGNSFSDEFENINYTINFKTK
ncbi:hypothetical protein [Marinitoga sp. 38H-ov]|uniref:hypothetical protein n=1 Tax=Marinitoga sp. 38H-ov TaxID=1755814 RepID=UPI0013ED87C3|nr:hypothetical protein [Marinitoga sp. 38H-ov]KAF2956598.1 hypothetical protein AS160_05215 [Marinitoga sp. 38H-ov]